MDSFILGEDIPVMTLTASRFPEGISEAFSKLHSIVPDHDKRRWFGISHPDKEGKIIYKAAAEELEFDESKALGLERFVIRHGAFMSFYIKDCKDNMAAIKTAFDLLTAQEEADPNGYCLEWYIGDDVKCLVPSGPQTYPPPQSV